MSEMENSNKSGKEDNLKLYEEYNKTLRTWLVGFGFGVPAMFIVNQAAQKKLMEAQNAEYIIFLFLAGAAIQVLMALLNKVVSWCAYHRYDVGENNCGKSVNFLAPLENWFIIDVILDVASLLLFGWSIFLIMKLFI